jgi:undecaprenyl-diphosphatase
VGSIPAGVVGLLFHDTITRVFNFPSLAAFLLVLTGVVLLFGKGKNGDGGFTWSTVLLIGIAQAVAILPGFSRSGLTITTALLLGVGFSRAAEFSFLLSIPAIIGGFIFEFWLSEGLLTNGSALILLVGGVASFVSGFIALKLLLRILRSGSFYRFSYYLFPVGIAALIYFYYF